MKHKELTQEEKALINGGNRSMSAGTEINIGAESLLSLEQNWQSGDQQSSHKVELVKGLDLSLGTDMGREGN